MTKTKTEEKSEDKEEIKEEPKKKLVLKRAKRRNSGFYLHVELTLVTEQLGTLPADEEIFEKFIKNKGKEIHPDKIKEIDKEKLITSLRDLENQDEVDELEERQDAGTTVFMSDEKGPHILEYMVKGFLRNVGNILKDQDLINVKQLRNKIGDGLFITPRKLYWDNKIDEKLNQRAITAMTARGKRSSLKQSEVMPAGSKITFYVISPNQDEISADIVKYFLNLGLLNPSFLQASLSERPLFSSSVHLMMSFSVKTFKSSFSFSFLLLFERDSL